MTTPISEQPIGIDVSHHQGIINFQSVRQSGRVFVIAKASQGTGFKDSRFNQNLDRAREAGLLFGAYHFLSHDPTLSGAKQAEWFTSVARRTFAPGFIPPCLDIENDPEWGSATLNRAQMTSRVLGFIFRLNTLTGIYPIIYGDRSFLRDELDTVQIATVCPLWIAHWGIPGQRPQLSGAWTDYALHQYEARPNRDEARVPGVRGACDVDRFNGSLRELNVFCNNG